MTARRVEQGVIPPRREPYQRQARFYKGIALGAAYAWRARCNASAVTESRDDELARGIRVDLAA